MNTQGKVLRFNSPRRIRVLTLRSREVHLYHKGVLTICVCVSYFTGQVTSLCNKYIPHIATLRAFNNIGLKRTRILNIALHLLFFFVMPLTVYNIKHSRKGTPVVAQRWYVVIHTVTGYTPQKCSYLPQAVVVAVLSQVMYSGKQGFRKFNQVTALHISD